MPADEAVRVAIPEPLSLAEPRVTPSTEKVTDPVGVPLAPDAVRETVAVRVAEAGGVIGIGRDGE